MPTKNTRAIPTPSMIAPIDRRQHTPWNPVNRLLMTFPATGCHAKRRRSQAACLAVVVLAIVAYVPALSFEFVNYDDPRYVTENPHVAGGLTPAGIAYAWTTFDLGNWIPVTWLSYLLDATLFGIRPAGFHLTNIVGHAANSGLLFYLLWRMTGSTVRSMIVAALFAVHPLHVQSVAWVAERKDILSTLFLLLAVIAYERYAAHPTARRYMCVAGAMSLGLLCKPMLVTLPFLLLLLDYWPLCRWTWSSQASDQRYPLLSARGLVLEKIPLLGLAFADSAITVIAQRSIEALQDLRDVPFSLRIGNAIRAVGWYLWKTVSPVNLSPFYPHPGAALPWSEVGLSFLTIAALSLLAGWQWKQRRYLVTGWLWFLVALFPVLGFVQVGAQAHADRYSYVPHIGLFVMAVWLVAELAAFGPLAKRGVGLATAIMLMASFSMLRRELAPWCNSTALWQHALQVTEENSISHHNLGEALLKQYRLDDARHHFQQSIAIDPNHFESILALASLHLHNENLVDARSYADWARRLKPNHPRCQQVCELLESKGGSIQRPGSAPRPEPVIAARDALRRGLDFARRGDLAAAESEFLTALTHEPSYADAHNNLGLVLFERGRFKDAESHFRLAMEADPRNADFACNMASLLENQSRWSEAMSALEKVLELKPTDVEARIRLERLQRRGAPPAGRDLPPQ